MDQQLQEKEDSAYQKKFRMAMKKFGITNPSQLKGDKKKEFYDYVDSIHDAENEMDEEKNPCWDGYKMVGTKTKDGKEVPNCVPVDEEQVEEGLIRSGKRLVRQTARTAGEAGKVAGAVAGAAAAYGAYKAGRYVVKSATSAGRAQLRREKGEKQAAKTARHLSDVERYKKAREYTKGAKKEIGRLEKEREKTKNYKESTTMTYRDFISEKAVSQAQQQAAGAALAAKRKGEEPSHPVAKQMAKMSVKELEKFAKTKHKDLPVHKEEVERVDGRKKAFKETIKRISDRKNKIEQKKVQNKITINPVVETIDFIKSIRAQQNQADDMYLDIKEQIAKYLEEAMTAVKLDTMHDAHGETDDMPATAIKIARALRISPAIVQKALDDMVETGTVIRVGDTYTYPKPMTEELQFFFDLKKTLDDLENLKEERDILLEFDVMNRMGDYLSSDGGKGLIKRLFNIASIGINVKLVYDFAKAIAQKDTVQIFTIGMSLLPMLVQLMQRLRQEMRMKGLHGMDQEFEQRLRQVGIVR